MARLFPTLPPSASSASAMTAPHERHADIAEGCRNGSVRLLGWGPCRAHARRSGEDRSRDPASGGLDEAVTLRAKRLARTIDHLVIRDRVHDLVRTGGSRKIDLKVQVECEGLPNLGLMGHHAVIGVQRESSYENAITHGAPSIAVRTRSACTVSATSWMRTMAAPFWTARRWAAIEPPMRSAGFDGVTVLMNR